jgi:hypothetical protein
MPTGKWRNVRRSDPCEICGKGDWCSRSDDGAWALCRRVDAGGQRRLDRAGSEYWLHLMGDAPKGLPQVPEEPRSVHASAEDLDRVYGAAIRHLGLADQHREELLRRGLDSAAIEKGGYRSLLQRGRAEIARELLARFPRDLLLSLPGLQLRSRQSGQYLSFGGPAGLLVPVRDLAGRVVALKVRRDAQDNGPKYLYISSTASGGPGPGAPLHIPVFAVRHGPRDAVRVTEGELKADLATHLSGILTISVPGVSAWRGVIPVLAELAPRVVHLAFDADSMTNPMVARATEATAEAIALEGYDVLLETWDGLLAKGVDDALAARLPIQLAPAQVRPERSHPTERRDIQQSSGAHSYKATPGGLVWVRQTHNGPVTVQLTNFRALIATDVLDDDGAEVRRRFEMEARLNGWCRRFTVTADAFAGMGWVAEHLGARAIVYPGLGLRDHARAAMQVLSGEVPERHVYSHTGWRQLPDGCWAYLNGRGAIGADGLVAGVEVALPDALAGISLPDPPVGKELVVAIRASLCLVDVGPDHITFPLLGAAYRAVFGDIDFALHLAGPTGAGKSELASLIQRHFGPDLDARHLPGSWSSTANALELLAFSAKDALLVVDDFAPTSNQGDVERAHREADRVLRAQGNRSGRLRMHADGTLRVVKPPRGLILSTGEDVPRGQSIRARLLACEIGPNDLDWSAVTASQKEAAEGRSAQALAGFLKWIAPQREALQDHIRGHLAQLRERAAGSASHRRTPEIAANLAVGWGLFLSFAQSVEAITEQERTQLWSRAWNALGRAVAVQAHHQRGGDPAQRFVELLGSAIASGRAHLAGTDGGRPLVDGGAWGWRRTREGEWEAQGERVGWLAENNHVYLDADASYAAVQRLGQEVGDRLTLTPQTLRKRLKERGVLVSTDAGRQVLTVRRIVEGQRREVLHVSSRILSPLEPHEAEIDEEGGR